MSNLLQNLHSCDLKWFWLAAVWCCLDVYRFGGVKFGIWLTGKYLLLFYRVQRKQSRKNVLIVKDYKTTFDFRCEITERGLNWTKKVENGWKKIVQPAFGCAQHPKAGRNTQQTSYDVTSNDIIAGNGIWRIIWELKLILFDFFIMSQLVPTTDVPEVEIKGII